MAEVLAQQGKRDFRKAVPINDVCIICSKTVYPVEKCTADDKVMHKACLRCGHCKKQLSLGNYAALNGTFYCKPHFKQLFALKGNYTDGFSASAGAESAAPKQNQSRTRSSTSSAQVRQAEAPVQQQPEEVRKPVEVDSVVVGKSLAERLHAYEQNVRNASQDFERSPSRRLGAEKSADRDSSANRNILGGSQESIRSPTSTGIASYLNAYKEAASHNNLAASPSGELPAARRPSYDAAPAADAGSAQLKQLQGRLDRETADRQQLESQVSELKRTLAARDREIAGLQQRVQDLEYQNQQLAEAQQQDAPAPSRRYRQDEDGQDDDDAWDDNQ